ncbi:MAG TPA: thiamine phosphate synthase [Polyangiaceae bacterium]|nr:thiamine phosphate synthase [Polyangiaceae bacterium]
MSHPVLIAITDFDGYPERRVLERWELLAAAAAPGTVAVQLRGRRPARPLLELGRALRDVARAFGQWLIVNDRLDLAVLLGADAVHLGEGGVATDEARRLFGAGPVFRACHDPAAALVTDADAVLLSPIHEARKGRPALGLGALHAAAQGRARVYALGGVTSERSAECRRAGAAGVAAIGAVFGDADPRALVAVLGIRR